MMDTEGKYVIRAKTATALNKRLASLRKQEREVIAMAKAAIRRKTTSR